ncbi:MAG: efflux RND transporter periplasmic adaptor subunit [Halieaceae bacterium]|nr:efflux RND transporter periplasmic adaptor subunit [Halieaceae bacterium]
MKSLMLLLLMLLSQTAPAQVQVATVTVIESHSLIRELLARVIAPKRQFIATEVRGVVSSSRIEMGTEVTAGQMVVEVESAEQQALVEIARSEYESITLDLAHKRRILDRAESNLTHRAISKAQFDEIETRYRKALVNKKLLSNRLALEETRLAKHRIKAPFRGNLVTATPVIGQYVRPGDTVFEVVNTDTSRLSLELTSSELAALARGDYALLCNNILLTPLAVSPSGNSRSGMNLLETSTCADIEELRPGQHSGVNLVNINLANVPGNGVHTDTTGEFVYVVSAGTVHRRPLTGLKSGDSVIVLGAEKVQPGDAVTVISLDAKS